MRPRSARRGVAGPVDRASVHRAAAESGHGRADLFAARLADDGSPSFSRRLSALRLLGVLINHGEQGFTASSRLVSMNGATPEDNRCGEHCRVHTGQGGRIQQAARTLVAETLAWARHVIGYFIAGMPAAVVTTLLPG